MNRIFTLIICILIIANKNIAQTNNQNCCEENPFIEVTGSAEMEITPDEIYNQATLNERYEGKIKMTIDKMEADMFAALKNISIESKQITLADAGNNFVYRKRKDDDALLSRNYIILVKDAATVLKVFDALGKIDAYDAFILKTSHSKIEEFRMQTKVNATKAAKMKATNMLEAIGNKIGSPIFIQEINTSVYPQYEYSQISNLAGVRYDESSLESNYNQISYQKIKIRYEVFAKFAIL